MLQLANPRHLSGLYRLCLTISVGYLAVPLPGLCGPAVTLRGLSGALRNAWLCLRLRLRLRLWLGEVGV